jgi:ParB family chromosome partitioning protein
MEVKEIELTKINMSKFNTRKDLGAGVEDAGLDDLANSIHEKGLLSPVTVMRRDDGNYDLVAGQRRFLACQKLGLKTIPAIIRDKMDDTDAVVISLIENVHRADMSPIDKAVAYQKIYEKYGDYDKVAKETGMTIQTVKRYLALLKLAPSIQEKITTSEGPAGVSALSKLAETFGSQEEQEEVLDKISGFKQSVQLEILKRSGGDVNKVQDLRETALEGAFDTHICHGIDDCNFIPNALKGTIKEAIKKSKSGDKVSLRKELAKLVK